MRSHRESASFCKNFAVKLVTFPCEQKSRETIESNSVCNLDGPQIRTRLKIFNYIEEQSFVLSTVDKSRPRDEDYAIIY